VVDNFGAALKFLIIAESEDNGQHNAYTAALVVFR